MLQKNIEKILIGASLAFAASALLPIAKSALRPLVSGGNPAGTDLLERAKSMLQVAREEVEDIFAEAQFERMKRQLDKEIALLDSDEQSI